MSNPRKAFFTGLVLCFTFFIINCSMSEKKPDTETFLFKDDGTIPNSKFPLVVYTNAFSATGNKGAEWLENKFRSNDWTNSWRYGVYPFHHYHSNTHEVLGVYQGEAVLMMGGEKGRKLSVKPGDIIVIPAGVGHKCLSHSEDFMVVGAYPDGLSPDLMRGNPGERPKADTNISKVPFPKTDPLNGKSGGILSIWKN